MRARSRRSVTHGVAGSLTMLAVLLLPAGCESDHDPTDPGPAVDLEPFRDLARGAPCADLRNRLFLVDNRLVSWDRDSASCADPSTNQVLYRGRPDGVLCEYHDNFADQRISCPDERFRATFETMLANLDQPNLGLGPFRSVEPIPF